MEKKKQPVMARFVGNSQIWGIELGDSMLGCMEIGIWSSIVMLLEKYDQTQRPKKERKM